MIYISVDIETTGLDSNDDQILSIGLVIEDTNNIKPIEELPSLHIAIVREKISGGMFAINLNKQLIENIVKYYSANTIEQKKQISVDTNTIYLYEEDVCEEIFKFLWRNNFRYKNWEKDMTNGMYVKTDNNENTYPIIRSNMPKTYLNVAGKNFGTFDKLFLEKLPRWKQLFYVRSRILDPAILFVDWKNDDSLPSLDKCKERAQIDGVVTHNALEDAIDVIKTLRKSYENI